MTGLATTPVFEGGLASSIAAALKDIPSGQQGRVAVGLSRVGADVSIGWKPSKMFEVGGYAKKLWGGGWTAGAQTQIVW